MKRDDLVNDPRVVNAKIRSEKIAELYELVSELVKDWTTNELLEALHVGDIPHGEATELNNLENDPHLSEIDFFRLIDHPSEGKIKLSSAAPGKVIQTQARSHRTTLSGNRKVMRFDSRKSGNQTGQDRTEQAVRCCPVRP